MPKYSTQTHAHYDRMIAPGELSMKYWSPLALLLAMVVGTTRAQAQQREPVPHNQDQPPNAAKTPAEAARAMTVPPGFTVEVVASEPNLVNPVAMTFDEKGRVWVTESLEYPRKSAGPGRDRIKILEDTDGDGTMDKFTVFAEGLNIPSGIAVGSGGVWVANAPDILFLKDTDGDGKADTREVVVTGFGRDDTHELPNSLTWGPDGWLYGLNGVFNRSVVTYRGKTHDFTAALFRIHPRTRDFELFAQGTSNPWGVAWNNDGAAFLSACVIDHLWHLTETGYYHRQGGPYPPYTWKLESIVDYKHQKAAYCGIHFFDSDAYPDEYRERLYMGNIHGGCINVDSLKRNGSTYKGIKHPDFLTANDAWFMPVVQKTGPDGCLYILDWYDRYHCYQDANRDPAGIDRLKGRLYRVRYKGTPRAPKFDLARESDDQLIERLGSPNVYYRDQAQRLLRERNRPESREKLQSIVLREAEPRKRRMHALWTLVGADRLEHKFHLALLGAADPAFRAWGVRAAGNMKVVDSDVLHRVLELAEDKDRDVILQVAIASEKIEGVKPVPILMDILRQSGDDILIPHIVWQNLYPLLGVPESERNFVKEVARTPAVVSKVQADLLPRAVERMLGNNPPHFELIAEVITQIASRATKDEHLADAARQSLNLLTEQVTSGQIDGTEREQLRAAIGRLLATIRDSGADGPLHLDAILLGGALNDATAVAAARGYLVDPKRPQEQRLRALAVLIGAKNDAILDTVATVLSDTKGGSVDFRGKVVASLGRLDDPKVATVVLGHLSAMESDLRPKAIELLTQRVAWSKSLIQAIEAKTVSKDALNLNQVRKLSASKDVTLAKGVKAIWGSIREGRNPQREGVIREVGRVLRASKGNPTAGAVVFKNVCAQCHKIYGEGQEVGPEITANGRASFEQLLSNVLDPSLVIGEAFQATSVATADGRVLTGLQVENSPQRIVLKMQGGKLETVPRANVDEIKVSALSLMPEDLEKQLKPQELIDLFAYLTLDRPPSDPAAKPIPGTPERLPQGGK
jgi:putative heme-binding domain-containing protein